MKNPSPEQRAAWNKTYYGRAGKAKIHARNSANKARNSQFVREAKDGPCTDCGVSYPYYVMQFDHLPEFEKAANVGRIANQTWGLETIQAEIDKCELVCANCHAERTHQRRASTC